MPVPAPSASSSLPPPPIFPELTVAQVDAARLSAWYDKFEDLTIPSTVIDLGELGEKQLFLAWLDSDSIFIPTETETETKADGNETVEGAGEAGPSYRLPKLGRRIRQVIDTYGGGVFPKLNWTAPRDAAFLLPQTPHGPLYCASAHDVYLLLKSSDFLSHALDPARAYEGCTDYPVDPTPEAAAGDDDTRGKGVKVELVLRRYEAINPSREFRCFVRQDMLIGVSVRDFNYYPHLQASSARERLCETIRSFWEDEIRGDYDGGSDYVFDIVLDDQLPPHPRLIDFDPYYPSTDPLLFSYEELHEILVQALEPIPSSSPSPIHGIASAPTLGSTLGSMPGSAPRPRLPILRVIDSQSHPEANRGMPAFGTNMMPVEMVEMSQGRGVGEFRSAWEQAVREGMDAEASGTDSDDDDDQ